MSGNSNVSTGFPEDDDSNNEDSSSENSYVPKSYNELSEASQEDYWMYGDGNLSPDNMDGHPNILVPVTLDDMLDEYETTRIGPHDARPDSNRARYLKALMALNRNVELSGNPSDPINRAMRQILDSPAAEEFTGEEMRNGILKCILKDNGFTLEERAPGGASRDLLMLTFKEGPLEVKYVGKIKTDNPGPSAKVDHNLREVMISQQLKHHGIIPIERVIELGDGSYINIEKWIDGESAKEAFAGKRETVASRPKLWNAFSNLVEVTLPIEEEVRYHQIAEGLFDALTYANLTKQIVHRDIHPGNIMIEHQGSKCNPRITDWEKGKHLDDIVQDAVDGLTLTEKGGAAIRSPNITNKWLNGNGPVWTKEEALHNEAFMLGTTLYYILTGEHALPYKITGSTEDGLKIDINGNIHDSVPKKEHAAIVKEALRRVPGAYRPFFKKALNMEYRDVGDMSLHFPSRRQTTHTHLTTNTLYLAIGLVAFSTIKALFLPTEPKEPEKPLSWYEKMVEEREEVSMILLNDGLNKSSAEVLKATNDWKYVTTQERLQLRKPVGQYTEENQEYAIGITAGMAGASDEEVKKYITIAKTVSQIDGDHDLLEELLVRTFCSEAEIQRAITEASNKTIYGKLDQRELEFPLQNAILQEPNRPNYFNRITTQESGYLRIIYGLRHFLPEDKVRIIDRGIGLTLDHHPETAHLKLDEAIRRYVGTSSEHGGVF